MEEALNLYDAAVTRRRGLQQAKPGRLDLAEELAVAMYLLAEVSEQSRHAELRVEIERLLEPFEEGGSLTDKGQGVLKAFSEPE